MPYVIGIDPGSHSVKTALFRSGVKGYEAERYFIQNVRGKGIWKVEETLLPMVKRVMEEIRVREAAICMSLPTPMVTLRFMNFPFSERGKIDRALPFELQGLLPFEMGEILTEYHLVEKRSKGVRVLCLMTMKERVRTIVEAFEKEGMFINQILYLPLSLINLVANGKEGEEGEGAIVNIGYERTEIAVHDKGSVRYLGYGEGGVRDALEDISGSLAITSEMAEKILLDPAREGGADTERVSLALKRGVDRLVSGISRLLMGYEISSSKGEGVKRIVISGGGARLRGLVARVEEETGIRAEIVDLTGFGLPGKAPPHPAFAGAISLCLSRLERRRVPRFNFTRDAFSQRRGKVGFAASVRYALLLVLIIFFGGMALYISKYSRLKGEYNSISSEVIESVRGTFPDLPPGTIDTMDKALAVTMQFYSEAEKKSDLFNLRTEKTLTPLDVLKEVSERIPDDVKLDISEFSVMEKVVKMKGVTDSFENVERIETAFRSFDRFREVEKHDVGIGADGKSKKFSFTLYTEERKKKKKKRGRGER